MSDTPIPEAPEPEAMGPAAALPDTPFMAVDRLCEWPSPADPAITFASGSSTFC